MILLLFLLVGAGGAYGVLNHYLGQINRPDRNQEEIIPPEQETFGDEGEEMAEVPAQPDPELEDDGIYPINCSDLINICWWVRTAGPVRADSALTP